MTFDILVFLFGISLRKCIKLPLYTSLYSLMQQKPTFPVFVQIYVSFRGACGFGYLTVPLVDDLHLPRRQESGI